VSNKTRLIATACLLTGVVAGAAGAQVLQNRQELVRSGLFSLVSGETARFFVVLGDQRGMAPATVSLRFLNQNGTVVGRTRQVTLLPGQSAMHETTVPGTLRAEAEVADGAGPLSPQRLTLGSLEVHGFIPGAIRPVCPPVLDPFGQRGGRN
jgi:hypothetical protein